MSDKKIRILVCPLDWGIGHASRCMPLIHALEEEGVEVVIAASGNALAFLRQSLPGLTFIHFPGISIEYPSDGRMATRMIRSGPGIIRAIWKEHKALESLISIHRIDGLISDNRFGLWSRKVPAAYITHQLMIKGPGGMGFLEPLLYRMHRWFIRHYDLCWIPDHAGRPNLSGDLSHRYPVPENARFIGPLSRFDPLHAASPPDGIPDSVDLLVMLSGPEPQRSMLENAILDQTKDHPDKNIVILQGLPGKPHHGKAGDHVTIYSHLPDEQLAYLIQTSRRMISRPGYSTIMDLDRLGKKAVFIPTPGQTEQEYLARYHGELGHHSWQDQNKLSLQQVFAREPGLRIEPCTGSDELLKRSVQSLLELVR